ncbi:MAG: YcaQ family DNA glycosylase, partial [Anaerolineae bacterium]|nr:YcaQ family DNA glycosylase [Anaerolineae bacterium]
HALAALYDQGRLMVDRRVNFQIQYNLPERVLPASAESPTKTMDDYQRWAALNGLSRLGVATASQVSDYYRLRAPVTREILETLVTEGTVVPVEVEGWSDGAYLDSADLPLVDEITQGKHRPTLTTFLSPFDNLTWNRERLSDLFDFDYRIELYTPKAQRKYGYYVLPILHNGRFVGRLDPKADRKSKVLMVHAIYLEPGVELTDELVAGLADALREFMAFHKSEKLTLGRSEPEALREAVLARME